MIYFTIQFVDSKSFSAGDVVFDFISFHMQYEIETLILNHSGNDNNPECEMGRNVIDLIEPL